MILDARRWHRRSIRLRGYDYSQEGAYFVTVCTLGRVSLFGDVVDGRMIPNAVGELVAEAWRWLSTQFPQVEMDEWALLPNHLHGIVVLGPGDPHGEEGRGGSRTAPTAHVVTTTAGKRKPLGRLIGAFKTVSTKQANQLRGLAGEPMWQRNFYEHIIRNEAELDRVRRYIADNPANWACDQDNPRRLS